jgi:protein JSN1
MTDTDVRTLDYLGLVETPQQSRAHLVRTLPGPSLLQQQQPQQQQQQQQQPQQPPTLVPQLLANFDLRNANRFRSYSVNAGEKYADEELDETEIPYTGFQSGALTPSAAATAAHMTALQNQIDQHNRAVQAFSKHMSTARPRARTAGILDTPSQRIPMRTYMATPSSRLDHGIGPSGLGVEEGDEVAGLVDSIGTYHLNGNSGPLDRELNDENDTNVSRSLWIGSIPVSTTNTSLDAIFGRYGNIESTRVLTHKNCGFVNFENIENAIQARQALNGKEIFPGAGQVRIGYAKAPNNSASGTPVFNTTEQSPTPDPHHGECTSASAAVPVGADMTNQVGRGHQTRTSPSPPGVPDLNALRDEMLRTVADFGASADDHRMISQSIDQALAYQQLENEIPAVPEPNHVRLYDAPRLRDIRKRIDNGACGLQEIEEVANDMLHEIAELSSDYLGNTVVQKLFELCSEHTKEQMLGQIAPHLAEIGVHKNGTWAAQKIIDVCKTAPQMALIVKSLRPYTIPLFLDQYGNYVLQCCLRFGSPYNDFIFETMLSHLWDIAQGRFGARAMRACLESHYSTKAQQRMLAAAIALHGVQLATNTNGALLLTWFLDTCTFPQRRTVLAPYLVSHIVHLCTHKVAYLTVLKVINQRNEPDAREIIMKSLFFSPGDTVLEQILSDQTSGATLIFKILTTPFFDENIRAEVVKNVGKVLTRIKAQPNQGYKRLMDEVGLSSRLPTSSQQAHSHSHPVATDRARPMTQPGGGGGASVVPTQTMERQYSGQYVPNLSGASYETGPGLARSGSADSATFAPYGMNGPPYTHSPLQQTTAQQFQYQAYLAAAHRSGNNNFLPGYPATGYGGYATPPLSLEPFRSMQNHASPLIGPTQMSSLMTGGPYAQQHYSPTMGSNVYNFQQQNGFSPQLQPVQSGGRRVRVGALFIGPFLSAVLTSRCRDNVGLCAKLPPIVGDAFTSCIIFPV